MIHLHSYEMTDSARLLLTIYCQMLAGSADRKELNADLVGANLLAKHFAHWIVEKYVDRIINSFVV